MREGGNECQKLGGLVFGQSLPIQGSGATGIQAAIHLGAAGHGPSCLYLVSHRPPMAPGESLAKPKVKTLGDVPGNLLLLDMPICSSSIHWRTQIHCRFGPLKTVESSLPIIRDFPGHSPDEISSHPRPRCFRLASA